MIYVNQKQLDQVEYLIEQSTRGHHILFDLDAIRYAFCAANASESTPKKRPSKTSAKKKAKDESAEKHIENLILQPTLISKKAYLESLNHDTYVNVVRTYFSIVENNIFESLKYCQ